MEERNAMQERSDEQAGGTKAATCDGRAPARAQEGPADETDMADRTFEPRLAPRKTDALGEQPLGRSEESGDGRRQGRQASAVEGQLREQPGSGTGGQAQEESQRQPWDLSYEEFLDLLPTYDAGPGPDGKYEVERAFDVIQGKWKIHVLFWLCAKGTSRFGELHRALPQVSKTMLSSVLKALEADGLVVREQFNEIPPHTEYSLTPAGRGLMRTFYELYRWELQYLEGDGGAAGGGAGTVAAG